MKMIWRSAAVVAAGGLAVAMSASPATAAPATGASVAVHELFTGAAAAVWTPEAMRSAIPLDNLPLRSGEAKPSHDVARGPAQVVQPTSSLLSRLLPAGIPQVGGRWTGGGRVSKTAGRVFFNFKGQPASCSGDAVTSGNKSVVITAGHCVKLEGSWHTNWVFVPGYTNGKAPYGKWAASKTMTTPQWKANEDLDYDVGAAVVKPLNGKRLTNVVGGQGIAFNQKRGLSMYAFGWPAETPYDGTSEDYCSGPTINAILSNGIGMVCDMTAGASGGPWLFNFNPKTGTGIQNSVNSYKINAVAVAMFGPYFGSDAQNLYRAASAS